MRIITGTARGRKLQEPRGRNIRPTTAVVKEAMFNIVQFDVEGRRVLDLFGGTGQLGLEAASRGAARVVIVDNDSGAARLIRANAESCRLDAEIVCCDAFSYLRRGERFDLIFLDPPYDGNFLETALNDIEKIDILSEGGIILCETRREALLPPLRAPYRQGRGYRYGSVKLTVYTKESDPYVNSDLSRQF